MIFPDSLLDTFLGILAPSQSLDLPKIDTWLSLAPSFEIELVVSEYIKQFQPECHTVAFIHSWDNLSSKGSLIRRYDKLLVWGPVMKKEVRKKLNYSEDSIVEVGMPQYDPFFLLKNKIKYKKKKQILYTTGHPETIPNELQYVTDVAKAIKKDFPGYKLIIRVHPNDDLGKYKKIQKIYPVISCEEPGQRTAKTYDKWMPDFADIEHFAQLLMESEVVINIASTIAIDASYFLTPVICLDYDYPNSSLNESIKRFYKYEHYQTLLESKGVFLCEYRSSLTDLIKQAIRGKEKENQQRLISMYDPFYDGRAGKRLGDSLR